MRMAEKAPSDVPPYCAVFPWANGLSWELHFTAAALLEIRTPFPILPARRLCDNGKAPVNPLMLLFHPDYSIYIM